MISLNSNYVNLNENVLELIELDLCLKKTLTANIDDHEIFLVDQMDLAKIDRLVITRLYYFYYF